jgi:hypothetical protein
VPPSEARYLQPHTFFIVCPEAIADHEKIAIFRDRAIAEAAQDG